MDIKRPRTLEPVRSKAFSYGKDGIKANDIRRASILDLRLLFRKNAACSRVRVATKPWVTAQLQPYGIPFKKSDSGPELKAVLETAVKTGKCNTLAPSIAALDKSLSEEYGRRLKVHAKEIDLWREEKFATLNSPTQEANFDLDRFLANDRSKFNRAVQSIAGLEAHFTSSATIVGWKSHLERAIDAEFTKLDSPAAKLHISTAEANFDLDRFLAKYFLDGLDGKPAPHKTQDPITLFPFFEHRSRLGAAVVLIPGLYIKNTNGKYGIETIIGWDIDEIQSRVRDIEEEVAKKRAKEAAEARTEREREWQQTLQSHHEYVRRYRVPDSPLKLDDLTGSYIVRCDEIVEEYAPGEAMTLDIVKPRNSLSTEAAFYFGIVEGTMFVSYVRGFAGNAQTGCESRLG